MKEDKKKSVNVPNLRFPGFKGEWKEEKLGEGCDVLMCKRIFAHQTTEEGHIPFYKIGTIGDVPDAFISKELFDEYKNKYKYPRKGEVLITCAGTVGKCLVFDGIDSYFQDSNIVWISNPKLLIENSFLYYFVSNVDWSMLNSTTITRLYNDDLRNLKIKFPDNLQEQKKIADFLFIIDQRIQTQIKIIENLESLMKGFREKIFSQDLRFKDDNGNEFPDWQLKKLGDVCIITMGQSPSSTSYNTDEIGIPLIQGNADILNRTTFPRNWTTDITKECKIGDLILTVRAPVGAVAKSLHNACIGRGVCAISVNSKYPIEFIYQYLIYFEDKWSKLEQGSTFTAISGNEIKKIELNIPCIKEQSQIADFLFKIDKKIEIERKLLQQFKNQKINLLSNLFL